MNSTGHRTRQTEYDLGGGHVLHEMRLDDPLVFDNDQFDELWDMYPVEYPTAIVHGREVDLPRWQYSFDHNYGFAGQLSVAKPRPRLLDPLLAWVKETIDDRLNGLLVNAYDGREGHYIGAHRDETRDLIPGSPIVTVSFGEGRAFRVRPWKGKGFRDFGATEGVVFVMPAVVNEKFTHEVPDAARHKRRRISVTFRAFSD